MGGLTSSYNLYIEVKSPGQGRPGKWTVGTSSTPRERGARPWQQDRVAFITGANKGIGLETARGLGKLGIAVVLASRDEAKGRAAADKLRSEGIKNVEAVRFDVTRPEDHQGIARHLEDRYGKLDILVNNAGVTLEDADFGPPAASTRRPP